MDIDSTYYNEIYCALASDYRAAEALNNQTVDDEMAEQRSRNEPQNSQIIEEEITLQRGEHRSTKKCKSEENMYDLPMIKKKESPSVQTFSTPSWNL